jgi:hypothetical protein
MLSDSDVFVFRHLWIDRFPWLACWTSIARRPDLYEGLAHLSGVLVPPIVYFLVTRWLFLLGMQSMSTETGRVCGLYSIFIVFILFGGSAAHLAISWVGHWILHSKHKIDQQSQLQHS